MMCLNPELKLEALAKHLNQSLYTYRNGIEVTEINLLILKVREIKSREVIKYRVAKKYQITISMQRKVPKLAERLNVT